MLKVVLDPRSLVVYLLKGGPLMSRLVEAWRAGHFVVISSAGTRAQLRDLMQDPFVQEHSKVELAKLGDELERFTQHLPGEPETPSLDAHLHDMTLLACAAQGKAAYLITEDRDLLARRRHDGTSIVNPGQILLALELRRSEPDDIAERFGLSTMEQIRATTPLDPVADRNLDLALKLQVQDG